MPRAIGAAFEARGRSRCPRTAPRERGSSLWGNVWASRDEPAPSGPAGPAARTRFPCQCGRAAGVAMRPAAPAAESAALPRTPACRSGSGCLGPSWAWKHPCRCRLRRPSPGAPPPPSLRGAPAQCPQAPPRRPPQPSLPLLLPCRQRCPTPPRRTGPRLQAPPLRLRLLQPPQPPLQWRRSPRSLQPRPMSRAAALSTSWARCPARSRSGSTSLGRPIICGGATSSGGGARPSGARGMRRFRSIQFLPLRAALYRSCPCPAMAEAEPASRCSSRSGLGLLQPPQQARSSWWVQPIVAQRLARLHGSKTPIRCPGRKAWAARSPGGVTVRRRTLHLHLRTPLQGPPLCGAAGLARARCSGDSHPARNARKSVCWRCGSGD